nr:hypothetical protein [candidate division Zixibacteria bacterium]
MRTLTLIAIFSLIAIITSGCGDQIVEIKSDGNWTCTYLGGPKNPLQTVTGNGNKSVNIYDKPPVTVGLRLDGGSYVKFKITCKQWAFLGSCHTTGWKESKSFGTWVYLEWK